ncbi:MAG TPA: 3-oxoacyl-[acyl-carrier-protein] synthase III C-terminal domain-containing protein [Tetrasphaera sp.]|nr:3-oxoacyl-[acyl-carrier-protein] synthase III C-terminal domain-containing protein [Tetrasphaera sp.]
MHTVWPRASRILAAHGVVPEHKYHQGDLTAGFAQIAGLTGAPAQLLRRLHANSGVQTRHLAMPLAELTALRTFGEANDAFIEHGVALGARALSEAAETAGIPLDRIDLIVSATVTGLAVPSLDARIASLLGLRPDVRRMPLVGLGCVAGAAGIARVHDYLLGHPGHVAAFVSVELCSLTVQRDDPSTANLVASGLFGDGAACVLMAGAEAPGAGSGAAETVGAAGAAETTGRPRPSLAVLGTRSRLYPDSARLMGWDVRETGLRIVLGADVPDLVEANVRADVDEFLAGHEMVRGDVAFWVAHPGGPKVLEALHSSLDVDREALRLTWNSLERVGNLSSASVLHVLADTLRERPPAAGSRGVLLAMGPGFCLECVLLEAR